MVVKNLQGTTQSNFRIGLDGPVLYQGTGDPVSNPPSPIGGFRNGDLYIRTQTAQEGLHLYEDGEFVRMPSGKAGGTFQGPVQFQGNVDIGGTQIDQILTTISDSSPQAQLHTDSALFDWMELIGLIGQGDLPTPTSGDLDLTIQRGWYYASFDAGHDNTPSEDNEYIVRVQNNGGDTLQQIAYSQIAYSASGNPRFFYRNAVDSGSGYTFGHWVEFLNSDDINSSSTIDPDNTTGALTTDDAVVGWAKQYLGWGLGDGDSSTIIQETTNPQDPNLNSGVYRVTSGGDSTFPNADNDRGILLVLFEADFSTGIQTRRIFFPRSSDEIWSISGSEVGESGENWTTPTNVYSSNNIIGTVSENNGTPTGAIIERGSNANGEYVRFADGTQIATTRVTGIDVNVDRTGYYQSSATSYSYPSSFSLLDFEKAHDTSSANLWGSAANGSVVLYFHTSITGRTADIMILGRWF